LFAQYSRTFVPHQPLAEFSWVSGTALSIG
jgi:hypothetical protein